MYNIYAMPAQRLPRSINVIQCFVNVCECSIHARSMHARQSISSQNAHGGYGGYSGILIMCHIADLTYSEFE